MKFLKNKVCVITGVGKGFGRRLSQRYEKEGAKLALITRSHSDIVSLREATASISSDVLIFEGDVSKAKDVASFIHSTIKKFGTIDVLLNNAGMRFRRPFLDIDPAEFDEVLRCNLTSMFYMCQAVIPEMKKKQKGKIVNISSILATRAMTDLSGYITSKAGVEGLTRALSVEFAKDNINVNAISPGFCKTSYYEDFVRNRPALHQFTLDRTPMGRWGDEDEITDASVFLSSNMSDYVTGQVLQIDGGWSAS